MGNLIEQHKIVRHELALLRSGNWVGKTRKKQVKRAPEPSKHVKCLRAINVIYGTGLAVLAASILCGASAWFMMAYILFIFMFLLGTIAYYR